MAGLQGAQPFLYEEDCTSTVEISVACSGLPKMDLFSKSDPFVTLYIREGNSYRKIGETEVKNNNHEPKFDRVFELSYRFEEEQVLKFVVEDFDYIGKNDYIGSIHVRLGELASSGEPMVYDLKDKGRSRGKITLFAEETIANKAKVTFYTRCTKLDKKDFFGKSDPYFEIRKIREGNRPVLVYKSVVIKSNLNPVYDPFDIGLSALCSGDYNTPLQFDIFDWNMSGKVDLIGSFRTSFSEISPDHGNITSFSLINPDIKRKKGNKYKNSGTFTFSRIVLTPIHTFVEYLKGGLQIQLIVAIDFTGSNGNPADPRSLHHTGGSRDNEYLEAIKSVGNILVPYDSDQQIPCFGFGAKLPPVYDHAHHCFPLNGKDDPEVNGIQGIIDAYKYTLASCRLSGPTLFSEILAYSKAVAQSQMEEYAYTILLIITDGVINDMRQSSDLIVEASCFPLSIVIVGVGDADFTDMNILDADDIPLVHSRTQKLMKNDIVQFVPLREVKQSSTHFNLAREVLAEVPGQVTKYMSDYKIKPRAPVARMFNAPEISSLEDLRVAAQTPPIPSSGYSSPFPSQQQPNPLHASAPYLAQSAQFNPAGYPLQQGAKYTHPAGIAPQQWGYQPQPVGFIPPASPYGFQGYPPQGAYPGPPGGNPPYPINPSQ